MEQIGRLDTGKGLQRPIFPSDDDEWWAVPVPCWRLPGKGHPAEGSP